jgi:hypothetical protein
VPTLLLSLSPFYPLKAGTGFLVHAQLIIFAPRFRRSFRRVNGTLTPDKIWKRFLEAPETALVMRKARAQALVPAAFMAGLPRGCEGRYNTGVVRSVDREVG